jgi:uncharacterized protein VirK/YbjX
LVERTDKPDLLERPHLFAALRLPDIWNRFRMWIKFRVRRVVYRPLIRRIERGMDTPLLRRVLAGQPDLVNKPIRSYLVRGLGAFGRADALLTHYRTAEARLALAVVEQTGLSATTILCLDTGRGVVRVTLGPAGGFYRETEWVLTLTLDAVSVAAMGVTIVKPKHLGLSGEEPCLWIGIMKSMAKGSDGLDMARLATKAMLGLRPKAALLMAAQALVGALGLSGLYAVANEGRVFAGYKGLRKRVQADYDQFWEESQGERLNRYVFRLPLTKPMRDLSTYAAHKRSQIRARQQLETAIKAVLAETLRGLVADAAAGIPGEFARQTPAV